MMTEPISDDCEGCIKGKQLMTKSLTFQQQVKAIPSRDLKHLFVRGGELGVGL